MIFKYSIAVFFLVFPLLSLYSTPKDLNGNSASLFDKDNIYPEIKNLKKNDLFFKQIISDISHSYMLNAAGKPPIPLSLYTYTLKEGENIFSMAARFNLPYDAISSVNRIPSIKEMEAENKKQKLLIPNQVALFIPEYPLSEIDFLLTARKPDKTKKITVNNFDSGKQEVFFVIIDGKYNSTERAFFLSTFFRFPLEKGRLTSLFGYRINPISGRSTFHHGIDIAAPRGNPVMAAGKGKVLKIGFDKIYGNFIIIKHPGEYETLYGHLDKILVESGSFIVDGAVIGNVGSTGYSTGSHLHFEVKSSKKNEDPLLILPTKRLKQ